MTALNVPASRHRGRIAVGAGAGLLLLTPPLIVEMLDETAGDPGDFVFALILLVVMGGIYELAARVPDRRAYLAGAVVAAAAVLITAWLNLAVGVIGSEDNPANLIFAGVIAVAVLGSLLARFRPTGMSYAMLATAGAQVLAFVAILVAGVAFIGPITVFFTVLWLISAWLFRRAAQPGG